MNEDIKVIECGFLEMLSLAKEQLKQGFKIELKDIPKELKFGIFCSDKLTLWTSKISKIRKEMLLMPPEEYQHYVKFCSFVDVRENFCKTGEIDGV